MDHDFIVGFTIFKPNGFKTMYRHFNKLETAKLFASNVNLKDNCKIYVDLDYYNYLKKIHNECIETLEEWINGERISTIKLKEMLSDYINSSTTGNSEVDKILYYFETRIKSDYNLELKKGNHNERNQERR